MKLLARQLALLLVLGATVGCALFRSADSEVRESCEILERDLSVYAAISTAVDPSLAVEQAELGAVLQEHVRALRRRVE